jgi:hypothetical protein
MKGMSLCLNFAVELQVAQAFITVALLRTVT